MQKFITLFFPKYFLKKFVTYKADNIIPKIIYTFSIYNPYALTLDINLNQIWLQKCQWILKTYLLKQKFTK
jgi:hypothetical protein